MTQHLSTIYNEIDFKIRCIAHFKKVFDKLPQDKGTREMMRDQTVRFYNDIKNFIHAPNGMGDDRKMARYAEKLAKKYDVRGWLSDCLKPADQRIQQPVETMDV